MLNRHPRILILTAGFGDGHLQVSSAILHYFHAQQVNQVQIIDLMKEAHPVLNSLFSKVYQMSTFTSQLGFDYYGWSYYMTRDSSPSGPVMRYLNGLVKRKMLETISRFRPDAIINTFPFGVVSQRECVHAARTFTVITDYALHSRWIHPDTFTYYVATNEIKDRMVQNYDGVAEKISVTGIPVRPQFYTAAAEAPLRGAAQGTAKGKRILMMAGTFTVFQQLVELIHLLVDQEVCEITVVCGRKQQAYEKLTALFAGQPQVNILGYVKNIHDLMAVSSCIVTKAGGITLSEAVILKLPIFILSPYGGQERENARYFKNNGMAQIASNVRQLAEQLRHFLSAPVISDRIRGNMAQFHRGTAGELIVNDILRTLHNHQNANRDYELLVRP
ncbi:processive 1,2-diacylglycerol beta-glucosyltransferase [Paenibacillus rhizosphaerae]|uniref:Processive 1,2-diacylglycerol beta-glucosyltransferase n=1 Tax=Paenibacillus rhizosphaerae TaxID=297318 RepID=A0A839TMX4_9BACL|nr:glycosyltransferase [Paenibacillus rhizosphaerae]MBB3126758.1 processive 1,2-diacylglycerol beta-glucosyltransferase [Paenibacillus rhizosphaerae]